jgi:CubicO group peptidase (beta-lactamase class C family)
MKLEIDLDFIQNSDGSWKGDISIPAQKAIDLPLDNISFDGHQVSFEISGVPGKPTFKGTLSEDGQVITGDFTQAGKTFPFNLKKEISPEKKARRALADFGEIVEKGLKGLKVPGVAVAVVKGNKVVLARGFGYRDVDKKLPMTPDTLLAIGSATKAFTTFTLGTLVDEGKVEWDKPVRLYIPWFHLYDTFATLRLTPRDLVTHRSGLPRHDLVWYNNYSASREEFVRRLAYLQPSADLREKFQYNNLMFLTAGYLIEVLTGQTWEEAVRERVLNPLEMNRTNFSVLDSQKDEDFAQPYREDKGEIKKIPFRIITNMGPAGSINSSVNEMSHWLMVHLNQGKYKDQTIIQPQTLQDMHLAHMPTGATPAISEITPADYGMGWFVDTYRGHQRIHHGGNIDGFSAMVWLLPQDGLGFVALANKSGTGLPELIIRHAADLILGLEPRDWVGQAIERKTKGEKEQKKAEQKKQTRRQPGTRPAHKLEEYTGLYHHPGYGDLEVFLKDGQLYFQFNGIVTPLEHWHYETFNALRAEDPTFVDMKFTFRTNVDGLVAAVEAPFEPRVEPIVFTKKPDKKFFDPDFLRKFVGRYKLLDQIVTISLKGNRLTAMVPGQPEYELVPSLGGEFVLKQVKIIHIKFITDKAGKVVAVEFIQPNGIFEAKRVK